MFLAKAHFQCTPSYTFFVGRFRPKGTFVFKYKICLKLYYKQIIIVFYGNKFNKVNFKLVTTHQMNFILHKNIAVFNIP